MQKTFKEQFKQSIDYMPQVKWILKHNASDFIQIDDATLLEDMKEATDLKVLRVKGGEIAVRVREPDCKFRDLTIRARTIFSNMTEIHKIRDGFGKWFFYGWAQLKIGRNRIHEWILVDLDIFRNSGLAQEPKPLIPNGDGTGFYSYPMLELIKNECLLKYNVI